MSLFNRGHPRISPPIVPTPDTISRGGAWGFTAVPTAPPIDTLRKEAPTQSLPAPAYGIAAQKPPAFQQPIPVKVQTPLEKEVNRLLAWYNQYISTGDCESAAKTAEAIGGMIGPVDKSFADSMFFNAYVQWSIAGNHPWDMLRCAKTTGNPNLIKLATKNLRKEQRRLERERWRQDPPETNQAYSDADLRDAVWSRFRPIGPPD